MSLKSNIKDMLSMKGHISIKRVTLVVFVFSFLFIVFYDLFTGHRPSDILTNDLFYLTSMTLGAILGAHAVDAYTDMKRDQSGITMITNGNGPPQPPPPGMSPPPTPQPVPFPPPPDPVPPPATTTVST